MATYQFKIELLPKAWAQKNKYDAKLLYDTKQDDNFEQYDPSIAWERHILSVELDYIISKVLPRGKSWSSDLLIWGDDKHTDIQAWVKDKEQHLESVTIRLDLRDKLDKLVNDIVILAKSMDCVLFMPETKQIIDPNPLSIYEAINRSSAAHFVKNPGEYLENITKKKEDGE